VLLKSTQISPEGSSIKWMNLAQLETGKASLQCFDRGITLMIAHKKELEADGVCMQRSYPSF